MWMSIADEKEKYAAYLCSPEWGALREQVKARSCDTCELCLCNPMDAAHHKTYIRKYHENLDDLVAVCSRCHDVVHGKAEKQFMRLGSSAYVAGKISFNCFRHSIVRGLRDADQGEQNHWTPRVGGMRTVGQTILYALDYSGPFFMSCDHGCFHGPNTHGAGENNCMSGGGDKSLTFNRCLSAIARCNLFLAWIDSSDAYGTLTEIGFAHAYKRPIYIGYPDTFDISDMWFACESACCEVKSHASFNDFAFFAVQSYIHRSRRASYQKVGLENIVS